MHKKALVVFRNDLRIEDNHALLEASENVKEVHCLFIFDEKDEELKDIGKGSQYFLSKALDSLSLSLKRKLQVKKGDTQEVIEDYLNKQEITSIYFNRSFDPFFIKTYNKLKKSLQKKNIEINESVANLLWEPGTVLKANGTPYKVFTAFYKNGCMGIQTTIMNKSKLNHEKIKGLKVSQKQIKLLFSKKNHVFDTSLDPSEKGATKVLQSFIRESLSSYKTNRDIASKEGTSYLSPYLHFGIISIRKVFQEVQKKYPSKGSIDIDCFLSQLGWREFSSHLLYHFPTMKNQNLNEKFNRFKWKPSVSNLKAWKEGKTGYPFVDAAMRELVETGLMHNRLRMVVASFLTKNLLIDWRVGMKFFSQYLLDADIANNASGWQWVAGCGVDSSPYFRVFNPTLQGTKFDKDGAYTKKYLPELKDLPEKYLFTPWDCPDEIWDEIGIKYGKDYPKPIVDQKKSRLAALAAHKRI